MRTPRYFLPVGLASLLVQLAPAQDWIRTTAPYESWSCVASSADGSRLVASARFSANTFNPGAIYVSTNSGTTWQLSGAPIQYWDRVASSADGLKLVAAGSSTPSFPSNSGLYTSTDGGATWVLTAAPRTNWQALASSADGTHIIAAAWAGGIYSSSDAGANWNESDAPSAYWQGLTASADGQKLAATGGDMSNPNSRRIYLSTNGGLNWAPVAAPTNIIALASSADGSRIVGVAGQTGVYLSPDAGQNWTLTTAPGQDWMGIASSADLSKITAVAGDMSPGPIFTSTDVGKSWGCSGSITGYFHSVACSSDGAKWVVVEGGAQAGYIYTSQTPPTLTLRAEQGGWLLSWPSSGTGFVVEQNSAPSVSNGWAALTNQLRVAGGQFQVSLAGGADRNFYRLKSQ